MILCRNVTKLVKYDLCFKYVEGVLTNRLNLFHFFMFLDFFPPTARIWNFWLARHIFLTCSKIEMLELKKHLVLFSPLKSVSFFFLFYFCYLGNSILWSSSTYLHGVYQIRQKSSDKIPLDFFKYLSKMLVVDMLFIKTEQILKQLKTIPSL